ncbi:MAG: outer membrane protein assembly factor BamD [Chitinophagaceae bacterium]
MRAIRLSLNLIVVLTVLFSASCNSFDKIKKSNDVNLKLTKANEYFEKKKYSQANELYHDLLPVLRGTRNYEQLFYRYAYTFYNIQDYATASLYFKNFSEYFPTSKDAEECEYMHAICLVKMAPKASLDQTNTIKSMEALQAFINTHQQSSRVKEANILIDDARKKLEKKDASAAKLYYNIGQYKAATISYKNIINYYSESPSADYYQFMVVKSNYEYARKSVSEKQAERYANTVAAYKELKEIFPKSSYIKDAEHLELLANNYLKKNK